jgi:hypothetical protein
MEESITFNYKDKRFTYPEGDVRLLHRLCALAVVDGMKEIKKLSRDEKKAAGVKLPATDEFIACSKIAVASPSAYIYAKSGNVGKGALTALGICEYVLGLYQTKGGLVREKQAELFGPQGFSLQPQHVVMLKELEFTKLAELFEDKLALARQKHNAPSLKAPGVA